MLKKIPIRFLVFFALFIFSPQAAWGNLIIPLLALQWPLMWIAFAPIVLVETWVIHKYLAGIPKKALLKATFWANFTSTLIGIPLTFLIASPINLHPTGSKFFIISSWFGKKVEFSLFFALTLWWFFFFPVSYHIEKWVARKFLGSSSSAQINKAVFKANLTSYGMLFLPTGFAALYFWFK